MKHAITKGIAGMGILLIPGVLHACTVCMGGPPSKQSEGVSAAIVGLLVVTYFIIGGLVTFSISFWCRSKAIACLPENLIYQDPDDRTHS